MNFRPIIIHLVAAAKPLPSYVAPDVFVVMRLFA